MWQDPIIAETRKLRDEYASQFDYNLDAMFEDLLKKQATHPKRIVSLSPRETAVINVVHKKQKTKSK